MEREPDDASLSPNDPPESPPRAGWRPDALIAAALTLAGFLSVALTYGGLGWTWDESYYLPPARLAGSWARLLAEEGLSAARSPGALERHWGGPEVVGQEEAINELPGACKWLWALGLALFESRLGTMAAMRLPSAMLFGLTLAAVFGLCRRFAGRGPSVFGALCLLAMPRVFGHAHVAATDTAMAFMAAAASLAFVLGIGSKRWAVAAGVAFGAALATKINAFFLFPALFLWAYAWHRDKLAHPVAAMIFLGPPVFVLLWPWLWTDTPARILEYLSFHATHQQTAVFYMGQKWGFDRLGAPWHYPFVLLGASTPPFLLGLVLLGTGAALARVRREPMALLLLIQALLPLAIIAAPGQPKYDGVRLFLPAYPFLACLCAFGLEEARKLLPEAGRWRKGLLAGAFAGLALAGGVALWSARPFHLSYFNALAGGVEGAWDAGFETTAWGEPANADLLDWLNDEANVPAGSSILTRAMFDRVLRDYQAWGMLRKDLRIGELPEPVPGEPPPAYDFHLINARRGFWGNIDWRFYAQAHRAKKIFAHRGAPMLFVFGSLAETFPGMASRAAPPESALSRPSLPPAQGVPVSEPE